MYQNSPQTLEHQARKMPTMPLLKPQLAYCINDDNIDWARQYPLTPTGSLDMEKAKERGLPANYGLRPVPVLATGGEEYENLRNAVKDLRQLLTSATDEEIIFELKKLSTHCGISNRESVNFAMMLDDYLDDLAAYPIDLLRDACRQYRNSPNKENDFFPRPGKLIPLMLHE